MSRTQLINMCKELGITKGLSNKNKDELIRLISKHNDLKLTIEQKNFNTVLNELKLKYREMKKPSVCSNCNEIGHGISSIKCPINIQFRNKQKDKIKKYMLSRNLIEDKTIDEHCNELSIILGISSNLCRTLYNEIPAEEFILNSEIDITSYFESIQEKKVLCSICNKQLFNIQENTIHIWKSNQLCDNCWGNYENEREIIWDNILSYKPIKCQLCNSTKNKKQERYHYDHINMFDKNNSISSMVNEGINIEEIYKEIDKCQILCLTCHHIVSDIEHKLGFTRIKQSLTRKLNQNEITEEEHENLRLYYQKMYEDKMSMIYFEVKIFRS